MHDLVQGTAIYTTEASVGAIFSIGAREEKMKPDPCSLPNENSVSWEPVFPPILHHLEISHQSDKTKVYLSLQPRMKEVFCRYFLWGLGII